MCCDLQTHTKVIAIINLLVTGLGIKKAISQIRFAVESNVAEAKTIAVVSVLSNTIWALAVILCLVGAFKRKRYFLIPFMVGQSISILIFLILSLLIIILGSTALSWISQGGSGSTEEMQIGGMVGTIVGIVLVIFFISIGLSVYFLVIVAKFYKELASECSMNYAQREGMVLQPLSNTEGSKMYVPPDSQNLMNA